jgi:peptidoglycan-associated lipoprotein
MKNTHTKKAIALLCITGLFIIGCGKITYKEAMTAYKSKQYELAGDMFNSVASAKTNKKTTPEQKELKQKATFMAAESYRNANNYKDAAKWYEKTLRRDKTNSDAMYRLATIYQRQNKFREAIEKYAEYLKEVPGDEMVMDKKEFCEKALSLSEDSSRFEVSNFKIANTKLSDYSPMIASKKDDKLYFTSDRVTTGPSKKRPFVWTGRGYSDLYFLEFTGKRNKKKWQRPQIIDAPVNTKYNDGVCAFDRRYSVMYFTICNAPDPDKKRDKNMECKIYMSRRQGKSWTDPEMLSFCKDTFTYGHPVLSPDGTKLYFSSNRPGGYGGHDIYVSNFVRRGRTWSQPINLGETINTKGDEVFPYWNKHDNMLYYSSNGLPGLGGLDLFRTEGSGEEWTEPENLLKPMNSGGDDFGITFDNLKDDHGFFTSDRAGGRGSDDIYEFTIKPLVFTLAGQVTDCFTNNPLGKSTVHLSNGNDTNTLDLKVDENGYYKTELTAETAYDFFGTDKPEHYFDSREYDVSTEGLEISKDFIQDICLKNPFDDIKTLPIYYGLDSAHIWTRAASMKTLDELIEDVLKKYPFVTIELGSHTDCRSSYEYNIDLSQRRADSAVAYLIHRGIDVRRIAAKGYGESQLINKCACEGVEVVPCSEAEHQENRRTTVRILSKDFDPKDPKTYASSNTQYELTLEKDGNKYLLPVQVNGSEEFNFTLYPGNMLLISSNGLEELKSIKRILSSDIKGTKQISLPNGKKVTGKVVNIRAIRVGRTIIKNVQAAIVPNIPSDYIFGEELLKDLGAILDPNTGKLKFEPKLGMVDDRTSILESDDANNTNVGSDNKDALQDGPVGSKIVEDQVEQKKNEPDSTFESAKISKEGSFKMVPLMINEKQAMNWNFNPASRKTVITEDDLKALMDAGVITKKDFLDGTKIKLSNGLKLRSNKFKIAELKFGEYVVKNITIEVSQKAEVSTLGRAFFRKFDPNIIEKDGKLYLKPKRRR